jgi:hypothetical protein
VRSTDEAEEKAMAEKDAARDARHTSPSGSLAHQVAWTAAGLRRAARSAGVELPVDYARRVAHDGLRLGAELAVTRLGQGVVIRTVADTDDKLPVVVGYADRTCAWYRDGSRHVPAAPAPPQPIRTGGPEL